MITRENGWLVVEFDDWSPAMMALACVLSTLPPRPHAPPELLHFLSRGIQRLRAIGGDEAVRSLYDVVRDLAFRPTCHEVVELGRGLLSVEGALRSIVRDEHRP